jgi:erythromycin esterase-like protein
MNRFLLLALIFLATPAAAIVKRDQAMDAVVHDLCNKNIALLGEADHGDGRTVEFKTALIEQLIRRCHYNAVFFEASHYDFMALERKLRLHQPSSADMLSSAIGGIWNRDEELRQLIPFLYTEAEKGKIRLGGLDDQLGVRGAFYSLDEMPFELASRLDGNRRTECGDTLKRRIYHDYPKPYDVTDRAKVEQCLDEIASAISAKGGTDPIVGDEQLQMVTSIRRAIARDFLDQKANIAGRDRSMFLHFQWLSARLPRGSKIIVWAATAHLAKDASALPEYAKSANLGSLIHQAYGRRAFVLGFSAASGAHYWSRQEPSRSIDNAGAASVEAHALTHSAGNTAYLGPSALTRLGPKDGGALFFHKPLSVRWSEAIDGLVVFPDERPPHRLDTSLSYP